MSVAVVIADTLLAEAQDVRQGSYGGPSMGTPEYYGQLVGMSLTELLAEFETEVQALNEILASEPYEERGRQLDATRDNIAMIKRYIGERGSA